MDGTQADPIEWERLERFAPSSLLVEHFSRLAQENRRRRRQDADAGSHNLAHFRMMNQVVLSAWSLARQTPGETHFALILGAKECSDVPLQILSEDALVFLVDVDGESLYLAKQGLRDPRLRARVETLRMDVSLFESGLIKRVEGIVDRYPSDIEEALRRILVAHGEVLEGRAGKLSDSRLPVRDGSVDLVVSSMLLSQFMSGYLQVLLRLFVDAYGREQTRRCLLPAPSTPARPGMAGRMGDLLRSASALARRAAEVHVAELCRIVRDGGLVVLSDHALHGRCVLLTEEEIEVDLRSLVPYSQNPEEQRHLCFSGAPDRPLPPCARVNRMRPQVMFTVKGVDALGNIIARIAGKTVVQERRWWWVTERAREAAGGVPVWHVSLVEAFAIAPRSSFRAPSPVREGRGPCRPGPGPA